MSFLQGLRVAGFLFGGIVFVFAIQPLGAQQPAPSPIATADQAGKLAASVNGAPITDNDLRAAEDDIGSSLPAQVTPEQKRDYLIGYVIDLKLAAGEAEKQKALSQDEIDSRLAYFKQKILMDGLMAKIAKEAATEEAMKKLYDDTSKTIQPEDEVHARHILLESEDDAKKAYERVKNGEDFSKIAKELSKDPGSADGGDLGWFTKDKMVKAFADAAFAMKPGEMSQPVKSDFGWHIIKLEERRTKPIPPFDQVKPQIEQYLMRKAQQDFILKLRETAKIERPETPKPELPSGSDRLAPGGSQTDPAPSPSAP